MVVFVNYFDSTRGILEVEDDVTVDFIKNYVCETKGYPKEIFKIIYNGCYISELCVLPKNSTIHVVLSLLGGKGGFGSMLRAIGAQIEKTTNREACRDLSGRRLRDINEEQRLKRWISKKAEREKEAAERRRQKLERLRSLPKHDFHDKEYDRERQDLSERMDDALTHGLKSVTTTNKRKMNDDGDTPKPKKGCLWLGIDDVEDDEKEESTKNESSESHSLSSHAKSISSPNSTAEEQNISDEAENINCDELHAEAKSDSLSCNKIDLPSENGDIKQNSMDPKSTNLLAFQNISELKALGLDHLKSILQSLGMKCGGTLQQRAERLWSIRGIDPSQINPSLLAKPTKLKK